MNVCQISSQPLHLSDMIITYIHQYFNTPAMSGSTRSYEMAKRLVKIGHEVNLITSKRDDGSPGIWEVTEEDGIKVHWVSVPYSNKMNFRERIRAFFLFAVYAARRAAAMPTDVIFATSTPLTIVLPAIFAKWRRRVPMVLEVRDLWPDVPIAMGYLRNPVMALSAKLLERFAYANSAWVVTLSPDMKDGVARTRYPRERIDVIPNGADTELFTIPRQIGQAFRQRHNIPLDVTLMVYAGTLGRVNGVGYLVKLAAIMAADERFFILIVGDGVELDAVKSSALTSGCLGKNLKILKPVSKMQMPEILNAADIVISTVVPIPALEANSANKVFDGMAAGCCIAINHGGWLAELLEKTGAGIVLSQDVEESARRIKSLLDYPAKLAQMRISARQLAADVFSRDKLAYKLDTILRTAVSAASD